MLKKIFIRVDANEIIATGHAMRCLSIAAGAKKQGIETVFLVADEKGKEFITDRGFSVICLDSKWDDLESELDKVLGLIEERHIETLLIDSYYVTERYLAELTKHTRTIYIDDLDKFIYPVDVLVNYSFYAESLNYEERYKGIADTRFLLGPEYAPLREEFSVDQKDIKNDVHNVLLTSGGSDTENALGKILEALSVKSWFHTLEFHVIMGKFNVNEECLKTRWGNRGNVHLLSNVNNMADYMQMCDMAISAAGSTLYELCACGVPTVLYTLADNQIRNAEAARDLGVVLYCGDIRDETQTCIDALVNGVERLMNDYEGRCLLSKTMQCLVNMHGYENLVEAIWEI